MKRLLALFGLLAFLGSALPASAQYITPTIKPVCVGGNTPSQISSNAGGTAGRQVAWSFISFCPRGMKDVRLMFSGINADVTTHAETNLVDPQPMNLSIAVLPGQLWNPTRTYQAGETVIWNPTQGGAGNFANNALYTAVDTNTNSWPTPGNAHWSAGAAVTLTPVTCNGSQTCGLTTTTNAGTTSVAGTTQAIAYFTTDPAPVSCTGPCFIQIRGWINQSGTQVVGNTSQGQPYALGGYARYAASQTDYTVSGYAPIGSQTYSAFKPAAILGTPLVDVPTACVIGDSISNATTGSGVVSGLSQVAAGTGVVVGEVFASPDTGTSVTPAAIATPARFLATTVSAGAVSSLAILGPGAYTNTANQTGLVLPSGTQTLVSLNGVGSGVQYTFTISTAASNDSSDQNGCQGWINQTLCSAGVPWVGFEVSGDTMLNWNTRSYSRLAQIRASGCSTVIIEQGVNDISAGTSAANIETYYTNLANKLAALGTIRSIILTTTTPTPTSSTTAGLTTPASQTVGAHEAARLTLNAWKRGLPAPFTAIWDVSTALETAQDSGKWSSNGTGPTSNSVDGTHITPFGIANAVAWAADHVSDIH